MYPDSASALLSIRNSGDMRFIKIPAGPWISFFLEFWAHPPAEIWIMLPVEPERMLLCLAFWIYLYSPRRTPLIHIVGFEDLDDPLDWLAARVAHCTLQWQNRTKALLIKRTQVKRRHVLNNSKVENVSIICLKTHACTRMLCKFCSWMSECSVWTEDISQS